MVAKYLGFAAMICASTAAVAQPSGTGKPGSLSSRTAVQRAAVLDNIIGRVQMDALVAEVLDQEMAPAATTPTLSYANATPTRLRTRG